MNTSSRQLGTFLFIFNEFSLQNVSEIFLGHLACTACLRSTYIFSLMFKPGVCEGHSKILTVSPLHPEFDDISQVKLPSDDTSMQIMFVQEWLHNRTVHHHSCVR